MEHKIEDFVIPIQSDLHDALIKMTAIHKGMLLVVDVQWKLLGVLSDGDIRRALLNDISLNIPVEQIMNLNPIFATSREDAMNKLKQKPELLLVPIINSTGEIIGLTYGNDQIFIENINFLDSNNSIDTPHENKKIDIIALIPARGGSKRIPNKNLSKIGEDTLVSLAIKAAKDSKLINQIIVSTDNEAVANEALKTGIKVPWLRPAELSEDNVKTVDVLIHSLNQFKIINGYFPELLVLLEPTAPLRTGEMIDKAVQMLRENPEADSIISVNSLRHNFHPEEILKETQGKYLKPYLNGSTFESRKLRNDQDQAFVQNGLVYVTKCRVLVEDGSIYGKKVLKFETDSELFCDIDEKEDLLLAKIKLLGNV